MIGPIIVNGCAPSIRRAIDYTTSTPYTVQSNANSQGTVNGSTYPGGYNANYNGSTTSTTTVTGGPEHYHRDARYNGMKVTFMNVTDKVAKVVIFRFGTAEIADTGIFSPNISITHTLAAPPGACMVEAVRYADGTEWDAPLPLPDQ